MYEHWSLAKIPMEKLSSPPGRGLLVALFLEYLPWPDNFWVVTWFWLSMLSAPLASMAFMFVINFWHLEETFWFPINFTGTLEEMCCCKGPSQAYWCSKMQQYETLSEAASSMVLEMHSASDKTASCPQDTDVPAVNWKTEALHLLKLMAWH